MIDPRLKLMIDKLVDQEERGCIDNDWACEFIQDMKIIMDEGRGFSPKQILKIEELFEQY